MKNPMRCTYTLRINTQASSIRDHAALTWHAATRLWENGRDHPGRRLRIIRTLEVHDPKNRLE
jgi:hypothetical protein